MAQLSPRVLGMQDESWDGSNTGRIGVGGSLLKLLASCLGFCNDRAHSGNQRYHKLLLLLLLIRIIDKRVRIIEIIIMKIMHNRLIFLYQSAIQK